MSTVRQRVLLASDANGKAKAPKQERAQAAVERDELFATLDADLPAFTPTDLTIKDVLNAIPAHCFERSAIRSGAYVLQDLVIIAGFVYAATFIDSNLGIKGAVLSGYAGVAARWAAWATFWALSGYVYFGLWVLGHECGHQAFSTSKSLNNAVGLAIHSVLLTPYHSWRISHARHHAATGHMTRDEVFVPKSASERNFQPTGRRIKHNNIDLEELVDDAPLYRLWALILQQVLGWPLYLTINVAGQPRYPKWTNHFDPQSIIFDARHRRQILLSDAALGVALTALTLLVRNFGFGTVFKYYGVPYLLMNSNLVHVTYLQHTDPELPHYRAGEWNFVRGAMCTMDRSFMGPIGTFLMHGIAEWHVAHHLVSKIPHYHGKEATEAIKRLLGDQYRSSNENVYYSLWKNWRMCWFVDDESDVVFYRDAYGRAQYRVECDSKGYSDSGVEISSTK